MASFIELTHFNTHKPLTVNITNILYFEKNNKLGTDVFLIGKQEPLTVEESESEIRRLIDKLNRAV